MAVWTVTSTGVLAVNCANIACATLIRALYDTRIFLSYLLNDKQKPQQVKTFAL